MSFPPCILNDDSVMTFASFRRWLANVPVFVITLSPETITCSGTLRPDGNVIDHPDVSAVAVRTYFVGVVSGPASGMALTCHLPAALAIENAAGAAGTGAAAAAGAAVSFEALSPFAHATRATVVKATAIRLMF